MKIIISMFAFGLVTVSADAATRLKFLPLDRNMIVVVSATDIYGNADSDSVNLYELMLVPEQDSSLGKGKSIISPARDFNFVCSKEKKMCQVVLNKSENVAISSSGKFARFTLRGDAAGALTKLFKVDEKGEFHFTATDSLFKINGQSESFSFEAAEAAF
jgi:hypothetical protein